MKNTNEISKREEMNEVRVKYNNEFNKVFNENLTAHELNLLLTIISSFRDRNYAQQTTFSYEYLRLIPGWDFQRNNKRLELALTRFIDKAAGASFWVLEKDSEIGTIVGKCTLFDGIFIHVNKKELVVKRNTSDRVTEYLSSIGSNFTSFGLDDYFRLTTKYSKSLFVQLMQFKSTQKCIKKIDDLKKVMGFPKSTSNSQFMEKVQSAIIEINNNSSVLSNLSFEKQLKKDNRSIDKLDFKFDYHLNNENYRKGYLKNMEIQKQASQREKRNDEEVELLD